MRPLCYVSSCIGWNILPRRVGSCAFLIMMGHRQSPVEDLGGGREAAAIQSAYMLFADPLSQPHSLRQQVDCSCSLLPCIFHQLLHHLGLVCMIHSKMKGLLSAVSPHCYVRVNKNAPSFLSLLMGFLLLTLPLFVLYLPPNPPSPAASPAEDGKQAPYRRFHQLPQRCQVKFLSQIHT